MRITDALKNLNFQLRASARRQRANEFESAPEDLNGVAMGKPVRCVLCRKHQKTRGSLVVAAFFEVQRKF